MESKRLIVDPGDAQKLMRDYNAGLARVQGLMTVTLDTPRGRVEVVPSNVLIEHLGLWDDEAKKLKLPQFWAPERATTEAASFWYTPPTGRHIQVLTAASRESDGKLWASLTVVSWSPNHKTPAAPDLERMDLVKRVFLGPDREAYLVLPRALGGEFTARMLRCCLEGPGLPEFGGGQ